MAETLLGAHATVICPACGWQYDVGLPSTPSGGVRPGAMVRETLCPNCHTHSDVPAGGLLPKAGDRILVHKWPFEIGGIFRPQRWDVIVFRDPADPETNYIKRLVALPGESVELLDGDLYINGRIERKPPQIQRQLWLVVFDQGHFPSPDSEAAKLPRWQPDGSNQAGVGWSGKYARTLRYDGLDARERGITFSADSGREYFTDVYAYNRRSSGTYIGDVRIAGDLRLTDGDGTLAIELTRPPHHFRAEIHADGLVRLTIQFPEPEAPRQIERRTEPLPRGTAAHVEFAHVDQRVYVAIDGREVLSTTDAEYSPDIPQLRMRCGIRPIDMRLAATGLRFELDHLRVDRDVHYTQTNGRTERAFAGRPFTLYDGEYFVLGDNSPDSHDSREWETAGEHLVKDLVAGTYHLGTVRVDQIVGRAAFVYLPGPVPWNGRGTWYLPDLGRMRFIR